MDPKIEASWKRLLEEEFNSDYFRALKSFLHAEKQKEREGRLNVFPKGGDLFNAFNYTPVEQVKVVIIGQDPYHSFEMIGNTMIPHAHGLCFSIPGEAQKIPPSLKNIYKEIHDDIGCAIPNHGNLTAWAKQGVLLLNATLTVRAHEAGSHQKKGWETFTDAAIKKLAGQRTGLVFLLWGRFAQQKADLIDETKHLILKAAHPSPFSVHNGFFGCRHFSKANDYLTANGQQPIDWQIQ
ncbi:MAG: uracil-DNA glycosylase [Flavobacteriales bacterium]|nr:uracil-DNA glycosylase [Flavobacteriales bacterium]